MSLAADRTELWGDLDDFCGDGSCGIANRDDTRVVLRYEVTVPSDAAEPFDAYSCPGELNVMSGNSDEALSGVAGAYDRDIDGKIFPGQSKFGLAEYYIEKDHAGGEFYIESSCGDESMGRLLTSSARSADASTQVRRRMLLPVSVPVVVHPYVRGGESPRMVARSRPQRGAGRLQGGDRCERFIQFDNAVFAHQSSPGHRVTPPPTPLGK